MTCRYGRLIDDNRETIGYPGPWDGIALHCLYFFNALVLCMSHRRYHLCLLLPTYIFYTMFTRNTKPIAMLQILSNPAFPILLWCSFVYSSVHHHLPPDVFDIPFQQLPNLFSHKMKFFTLCSFLYNTMSSNWACRVLYYKHPSPTCSTEDPPTETPPTHVAIPQQRPFVTPRESPIANQCSSFRRCLSYSLGPWPKRPLIAWPELYSIRLTTPQPWTENSPPIHRNPNHNARSSLQNPTVHPPHRPKWKRKSRDQEHWLDTNTTYTVNISVNTSTKMQW